MQRPITGRNGQGEDLCRWGQCAKSIRQEEDRQEEAEIERGFPRKCVWYGPFCGTYDGENWVNWSIRGQLRMWHLGFIRQHVSVKELCTNTMLKRTCKQTHILYIVVTHEHIHYACPNKQNTSSFSVASKTFNQSVYKFFLLPLSLALKVYPVHMTTRFPSVFWNSDYIHYLCMKYF